MVTKTETDLTARVQNGIIYCNDLWQKMKATQDEAEYQKLSCQLDKYSKKLRELTYTLIYQGYTECVFGTCKFSEEFHCFACSKK